ncbi:MAG: hypothetical protein NVS3B16_27040 [Vulcanimicrobiaceae bacterium]
MTAALTRVSRFGNGALEGNVLYEDPEDAKQLARTFIEAVLRGRIDACRRGGMAREAFLQHFHEDVFIDGTLNAYADALERRRHRGGKL